jgi:hypothetical protein
MLGTGAAQPELIGQVAAQRAGDEQQRFTILDRLSELPVRAREKWWTPRFELIGFEASREQHGVPPIASELAFELARTDRRDRAQRAQAEQVEALSLLRVERQLT